MLNRPPLHYPHQPFHAFLRGAADRYPERIGLRSDEDSYTYRELDALANAFGTWLLDEQAPPGPDRTGRVLLAVANRPEWVVAAMGTSIAGRAVVLANPRWRSDELAHAIALTRPDIIVAEAGTAPEIDAAPAGSDVTRVLVGPAQRPGWLPFADTLTGSAQRRDLALDWTGREVALPFSSGTSGLPKAVRHTHGSLVAATIQWKSASLIDERDRLHFFLPLFHIYGLITVANAISAAAPLRLSARFDVAEMLTIAERERITVGFGAAPVALAMSQYADLERHDLSSIRYFVWAATPIDPLVAGEVTRRSGVRWLHAYGATEAPVLHCNPVDHPDRWRLDSPGLPVSDTAIRIAPIEGYTGDAGAGDTAAGEILARGPQVMAGYLPAEADREVFTDGWLRTGDIGTVEDGGWLHISDRLKEMIKVKAFQVAPAEIENVLRAHPAVADCAVYGVPDAVKGESPHAAVVLATGARDAEPDLLAWVAERVAGYKRLDAVRVVEEIPRTASGKVLRRELRARD